MTKIQQNLCESAPLNSSYFVYLRFNKLSVFLMRLFSAGSSVVAPGK